MSEKCALFAERRLRLSRARVPGAAALCLSLAPFCCGARARASAAATLLLLVAPRLLAYNCQSARTPRRLLSVSKDRENNVAIISSLATALTLMLYYSVSCFSNSCVQREVTTIDYFFFLFSYNVREKCSRTYMSNK